MHANGYWLSWFRLASLLLACSHSFPISCWWSRWSCLIPPHFRLLAGFLTLRSQIFNHCRSSLGHYATRSLSVDASELLNQHMSWGVFHDLFKFGLKLWVMPQKAMMAQRTEEGIIINRKKLFTICCNVLGDDIGNRHGLFRRAAGFTDPHQCLQQSLFLWVAAKNVISACNGVLMQLQKVKFPQ